ncbi:MAG TPA: hypothetical protein VNF99_10525 [Stellaceae bacterium]|nr:hypothetical protein [Stellaceae bacterium]
MMRRIGFLALALGMLIMYPTRGFAQFDGPNGVTTGAATSYVVTVEKFELCADVDSSGGGCVGAFVLGTGDNTFDIASVSAGAAVGSYANNVNLPIGTTFRYVRLTLSRTFTITGVVNSVTNIGVTGNCRTGGADATGYDLATEGTGLDTAGAPAAQKLNLANVGGWGGGYPTYPTTVGGYNNPAVDLQSNSPSFATTWPLAAPYTVTTARPTITLAFDTQSALGAGSKLGDGICHMGPQPPTIVVTIK